MFSSSKVKNFIRICWNIREELEFYFSVCVVLFKEQVKFEFKMKFLIVIFAVFVAAQCNPTAPFVPCDGWPVVETEKILKGIDHVSIFNYIPGHQLINPRTVQRPSLPTIPQSIGKAHRRQVHSH
jgi:hypothetical protein